MTLCTHSERRRDSRSTSRDSSPEKEKDGKETNKEKSQFEEGSVEAMMAAMGLPVNFNTTKGKQVEGVDSPSSHPPYGQPAIKHSFFVCLLQGMLMER